MTTALPQRILVIRNDKLGDFMLCWPAFSLLKKQYPDAEITALVPSYTRSIAELCPWIDRVIIDKPNTSFLLDIKQLVRTIKKEKFDASISLFSQTRTALALWLAGIPIRVAPATKVAQIFYNKKLLQKRSQSLKPEYIYNVDLVNYFISNNGHNLVTLPPAPYLVFDHDEIESIKNNFLDTHNIDRKNKLIFIHPGCGGSATNLSTSQYSELIRHLSKNNNIHFVITAGPDELEAAKSLSAQINDISHTIYHSTVGIIHFAKLLCISDIFISGSTGPLHLIAAANKNTVAFYPEKRSATLLRWETINTKAHRISFTHYKDKDMSSINIENAAIRVISKFIQ